MNEHQTVGPLVRLHDYIDEHAAELTSVDLSAPLEDLGPLGDLVGDARVVALGESSHHVREFYQLRHRMLRCLIEEHGFTTVVLEAPFTGAQVLDAWVRGGTGAVGAVASEGVAMSLGDVPELHHTLDWIRSYNARRPSAPVRLFGADLPGSLGSPLPALLEVAPYLKQNDPGCCGLLDRAIAISERFREPSMPTGELVSYPQLPEADRDALTAALGALTARMQRLADRQRADGSSDQHIWASHHLRGAWLVDQLHRSVVTDGIDEASTFRDLYMAETVHALLEADPDSRLVLVAHNWHIRKSSETTDGADLLPAGYHLAASLGPDYCAIGLTARSGRTGIVDADALTGSGGFLFREGPLPEPEEAAIESAFPDNRLATLVDLRDVPETIANDRTHPQMRMADYFLDQPAFSSFDALLCVADTSGTARTRRG